MKNISGFCILPVFTFYLLTSCSHAKVQYKISDHYNGDIFINQDTSIKPKKFSDIMKWWFLTTKEEWPDEVPATLPPALPADRSEKGEITYIGHSTFLIQLDNLNILTDPIWNNRASPFSFAGPKRVRMSGIKFEDLPKIDIVYISHNHYDHMDAETIERLEKNFSPLFIVPSGNKEIIEKFKAKNIIELDWWEETQKNNTVFIMTPAQHWSSRNPFDRQKALWASLLIKGIKKNVYFAGDTGYGNHFAEIAKKAVNIDVALLPIGAYEPRWFMKDMHMNPEEAVLAHQDLQAKISVGMHFGTFQLSNEGFETPVKDLEMAKTKLKTNNFIVPEPGQKIIP